MKTKIKKLLIIYLYIFPIYIASFYSTDWFYWSLPLGNIYSISVLIVSILLTAEWIGIFFNLIFNWKRSKFIIKSFILSIFILVIGLWGSSHLDAELHYLFNYNNLNSLVEKIQTDKKIKSIGSYKVKKAYWINNKLYVLNKNDVESKSEHFPTLYYKDIIDEIEIEEWVLLEYFELLDKINCSHVSENEEFIKISIRFYGHGDYISVGYFYFPQGKPDSFDVDEVMGIHDPSINHIWGNWYEYYRVISK